MKKQTVDAFLLRNTAEHLWDQFPFLPQPVAQTGDEWPTAHLDDLVEVGVLPSGVLKLAEDIVDSLCGLQRPDFVFLEVERGVVLTGQGLNVGLPEGVGVGALTQQVKGQCDISHGLKNSVLRI